MAGPNLLDVPNIGIALSTVRRVGADLQTMGQPEDVPEGLIDSSEVMDVLAAAAAMVMELSPTATTNRDLRHLSEEFARVTLDHLKSFRDYRDKTGAGVMENFIDATSLRSAVK